MKKILLAAVILIPCAAVTAEDITVDIRPEIKREAKKDTVLEDLLIRLDTYIQTVTPNSHRLEEDAIDTLTEW
jgi:predicted DNA-binding protein (UPF0278 family)